MSADQRPTPDWPPSAEPTSPAADFYFVTYCYDGNPSDVRGEVGTPKQLEELRRSWPSEHTLQTVDRAPRIKDRAQYRVQIATPNSERKSWASDVSYLAPGIRSWERLVCGRHLLELLDDQQRYLPWLYWAQRFTLVNSLDQPCVVCDLARRKSGGGWRALWFRKESGVVTWLKRKLADA